MHIKLHSVNNIQNGFRFYAIVNRGFEAWIDVDKNGAMTDGTYKADSKPGKALLAKVVAYMKSKDIIG